MDKKQLKEQLKEHLNRLESNKSTFDERATFECLYDCLEAMKALQKIEDEEINFLKKKMGPYAYPQVSTFNKIGYAFNQARKNSFSKMNPNPLMELKKLSPFENNARDERIEIIYEDNFETIFNVLRLIRNNLRHGMKEYTERSKQIINLANKILYQVVLIYNGDIKSQESFKVSSLVPYIGLILLGALMFFYLFGSLFLDSDDVQKLPKNCGWQYTPDNVECW
ncbi:MAG: hypothetical protein WCS86_04075 [Candidatus Paceibacterota bacterium]